MDLSIKLTMGAIPVIDGIGAVPLRELSAPTVRSALKDLAATRATRTASMTHAGLTRAIRYAEANDKVRRNVATLVDAPAGREGRPSKSLTSGQAVALIRAARPYGLYAYVVLSLLVGVRTEEARALRWDHVDLEGNPDAAPPVPPHVDVWRSVRAHGDTKTKRSRRSLGLPRMAVEVLREHLQRQADAAAGGRSVAGQRARLHYGSRDAARCGGRAPVAPGNLQESGPRQGVDAARIATHVCLSAVR
jgi:integrase